MKKLKDVSILFIINLIIFLIVGLSSAEDTNVIKSSEPSINNSSDERFVDNGDGTVTDHETNLIWLNEPKFFPVVSYDEALEYCKNLSYNDLSDWRLPTVTEFQSIIDEKNENPALISENPFKYIIDAYPFWTKDQHEFMPNRVCVVNLYNGRIGTRSAIRKELGIVWPVRDNE